MTALQPIDSPINRVLGLLTKYRAAGSGKWVGLCPAHDDRMDSLSVTTGKDGRVLLKCHAGCDYAAILAAMGLQASDLFTARPERTAGAAAGVTTRPRLVKTWSYVDANGTPLFESCRFEYPLADGEDKPRKKFSQRRRVGNEWAYNLEGIEPVLYRLPDVIEAVALGKLICIVEGEKCADALVECGYCATTSPMGAGKWRDSYADVFKNAAVVIFPDNDEPGQKHAAQVAASLHGKGATVRIARIPGLPPKGDIVDWLDGPGDMAMIPDLIARAESWGPKRVCWKLSELWNNDLIMRPPPAVVPRLAWAGRSTLLAAREKSGKSTLIGYVAARVSKGDEFLGEHCVRGDVLIVGLEEYLGDVARRLKHFGADGDKVTLVDGFLGDAASRPQEIQQYIEDIMPVLVVVDSLIAFANGRGIDENDAAMATVVQPLTDMAHATGTALMIVHHANKASGKARGSTSIMGATDVVCEFFTPDEDADPTSRRMRSVGRVPLIRQYDMRFDGDTYSLNDGEKAPVEHRIVTVIRERPGISTNDVCATVGGRREDVITALHRMQAERVTENKSTTFARAKWVIPENGLL